MTSPPQDHGAAPREPLSCTDGDRVVISGMAGLYPEAHHIKDLENILYNKVNTISSDNLHWKYHHPEVVNYIGNIPELDRFDAQFFRVYYHQGQRMDPSARKLLEQTYAAIYDAGVNPNQLNGKKVGVFVGTSMSESEKIAFYSTVDNGLGLTGCSKTMFANRISYWLNAKGPSINIDGSCCSSTAALEQAYQSIVRGDCESAIVGGANLCLHPQSAVHYGRTLALAADGKTRSFDKNATGTALSEAVNVLYLQKAKSALRIYADVSLVKCEFSLKSHHYDAISKGFCINSSDNINFLRDFYKEADVPPVLVEYVEAFGAADPETDKAELEAFDTIFCESRREPLLVGSVMSNIGYTGAASGISAITKVLVGYNKGELAGNLHYETPRLDVPALNEGRISILDNHRRIGRTYAAVHTLSITGLNGHVLLKGHSKSKDIKLFNTDIPRLVNLSGRQESAVTKIINALKSHPIDPEQLGLLHNLHESKITGHLSRGYVIFDNDNEQSSEPVSLSEEVAYFDDLRRPLWFVYSGMGSQWAGMGAPLMRIPIFAAAIERCRVVLEPKGIDIVNIICTSDKTIFKNILHSFVGIAAIQIGLTDILNELGLAPDKIIGHSVGELGCAYADGCLTAEEMILSAYSRGLVSLETPFIRGSMAAVGIGFQQMSKICPPEIAIACHNSAESCTISGPAEPMSQFVAKLTAMGIFATEVPCSNIAYHSRYIAEAGPGLLKYLKGVIKTPRARSERWVSTSVPHDKWDKPIAQYSSAEYHTNNLLSPVLFEESIKLIPSNAVLVEVAPHGLLQAILKRALPDSCTNIPLTRRGHPNNVLMLLDAVGKLYVQGYDPKIRVLYPKINYPVSSGTPFLSHLVEWAHEEKWMVCSYLSAERKIASSCEYLISIHDDEHNYLKGHVLRGKPLLPFSFALIAAWDILAMSKNIKKKSINVEFREVQFYAQPILYNDRNNRLSVTLHQGSGLFEIMNENFRVATGYINHTEFKNKKGLMEVLKPHEQTFELSAEDVYQILKEREYSYSESFRSIEKADVTFNNAILKWNKNWVTLIDAMIQLNAAKQHHSSVSQPDQVGRITIDIEDHLINLIERGDGTSVIGAKIDEVTCFTRCGGVVIENMKLIDLPPADNKQVTLKNLRFVPRFHSHIDVSCSLQVMMQIVAENMNKENINVIAITNQNNETEMIKIMKKIVTENSVPGLQIQFLQMHKNISQLITADVIIVKNLISDSDMFQNLYYALKSDVFIINEESLDDKRRTRPEAFYNVVSILESSEQNTRVELARWRPKSTSTTESITTTITIHSESELPLLATARKTLAPQGRLVIFASYPPIKGVLDIVKQLRKEDSCDRIALVMTKNMEMLEKLPNIDLAYNILNEKGVWGGEYYVPLMEKELGREKVVLKCGEIENLNSLHWIQAPESKKNGILVKVHYAGIHTNDVKRAAGAIPFKNTECLGSDGFGMEFSGLTENGERVMGLVAQGAASSLVVAQPELLWPVPAHWTLEDAATVPLAYAYAYYCLNIKVAIRLVEKHVTQFSVLVHGGAGALGQAIISIALAKGYKVFATVSDLQKKRLLLRLFPELNENDIGNSRDATFGDMIMNATNGNGCNIVFCCLRGELKNVSLKCCGSSGTTFDTFLLNNKEKYSFGMKHLEIERAYIPVDISSIFTVMKSEELRALQLMLCEGIALGHVRPLTRVTFAPCEAPRAFRLLAASRHRGRVLLRLHDSRPHAQPILTSGGTGCHLILCDKNHLGLQLADMLARRGACKIHIHIANPPAHLSYRLSLWKKLNVEVTISSECLAIEQDIASLVQMFQLSHTLDAVYVIGDENNAVKASLASELDLMTRKLCPTLKNFIVLSDDGYFGKKTCTERASIGLPATMLDLSLLKNTNTKEISWYGKAIGATELALRSTAPILIAQCQHPLKVSLIQQIAALADIDITGETSESTTLEALGIDRDKSLTISAFLTDKYHISIFEKNIPSLTIMQIKDIDEKSKEKGFQEVKGLGTFYSFVDSDELLATTEIVFMPTLAINCALRSDEVDESETFLCIVPGLEGHHERFRTMCERLKLPAVVLQPGLDHFHETPREQAQRYAKVLMKKTKQKGSFYLLGYETGVIIALELAAILEEQGKTGTVFCLGDGPEEIKSFIEEELKSFGSEEALQEGVVRHMFSLMARDSLPALEVALRGCTSWRARVDTCMRTLLGRVPHSAQYARALVETLFARICTTRRYSTTPRVLRSRLVLLRAYRESNRGEQCSLQRYSQHPLQQAQLAAPMPHAAADLSAAAIINRHLGHEILKAFEEKNLCQSYLINADKFLQAQN